MVRARARTRRGSAGAVLRPQPARQNPHDLEREIGSFVDKVEELFLADRREMTTVTAIAVALRGALSTNAISPNRSFSPS